MSMLYTGALCTLGALVVLDCVAILHIVIRKIATAAMLKKSACIAQQIIQEFPKMSDVEIVNAFQKGAGFQRLFEQFIEIRQSLSIPEELALRIQRVLAGVGMGTTYLQRLKSILPIRRIDAAVHLAYLGGTRVCRELEKRLVKESNSVVRVYIAYALSEIGDEGSLLPLVDSLIGAPVWYQKKVRLFIGDYGSRILPYLPELIQRRNREVCLCILTCAKETASDLLYQQIISQLESSDGVLRMAAVVALTKRYPEDPVCRQLLQSNNTDEKCAAIEAVGTIPTKDNAGLLLPLLLNEDVADLAVTALSGMCNESPQILDYIMHRYNDPANEQIKKQLGEVLANRIDYFIVKLTGIDRDEARSIIKAMIGNRLVTAVFSFLTHNKNREIENDLLGILAECIGDDHGIGELAQLYLDGRLLAKLGLAPAVPEVLPASPRKNAIQRRRLLAQLVVLLTAFPVVFVLRHLNSGMNTSVVGTVTQYVIDGNYLLIFYSLATSATYLLLLLFSACGAIRQYEYARVKKKTFLFKQTMLPGISIIGPAFNEEAGIIESVNSLLNLRYPDHEVIVVNDGSRDKTMQRLIEYFRLEKVDVLVKKQIATKPIRGIYRNRSFPKLTVLDKVNGGKADSLNAGINISAKEYFCGIDADSLLSEDSLLKMVSGSLDIETETVAMGGNIFPVNGCSVHRGVLERIGTPRNPLANFQFIEYLRAFMAGRVGWAFIDSMLIISGAFGLFKRKRVIECGGYLTSSGKFGVDTVGEDMELVVRVTKYMREHKIPYKIGYSHNANCWTEVPEKLGVLLRQRDRWHRGLIEILSFHRNMIGNRTYGRIGFIALPYFMLFEILGPWIEAQGYLLLVAAIVLGLLNTTMMLWLFTATVMFGVFISVASLIIAEQEINYFRMRDVLKLIVYAIVENFGFRQLMSMWRVVGYVSALRGSSGWGTMVRQGFGKVDKNELQSRKNSGMLNK